MILSETCDNIHNILLRMDINGMFAEGMEEGQGAVNLMANVLVDEEEEVGGDNVDASGEICGELDQEALMDEI